MSQEALKRSTMNEDEIAALPYKEWLEMTIGEEQAKLRNIEQMHKLLSIPCIYLYCVRLPFRVKLFLATSPEDALLRARKLIGFVEPESVRIATVSDVQFFPSQL